MATTEPTQSTNNDTPTAAEDENTTYEVQSVVPGNVGHLRDVAIEFECPACQQKCMTRVAHEAVTVLQNCIAILNFCLCCAPIKWNGRHDVNHYCSKCGCYIGRKIELSCYKRQLFKIQSSEAESSGRWQKFRRVEKEHLDKSKQKYATNGANSQET